MSPDTKPDPVPGPHATTYTDRTDTFYPADGAIHGYGAQLQVGDGGTPENFEAVAFIDSITPGAMTTADIVRTHLRSPDAHGEHMAGLRDSGAFQLKGVWIPVEPSLSNTGGGTGAFVSGGLIAFWRDRKIRNWKIVLNDPPVPPATSGTEWPFNGYVSQFQPGEISNGTTPITFTAAIMPAKAYDAALP